MLFGVCLQPYQVGILSQGTGFCGEFLNSTAPDLYMRVSLFVPWIQNITAVSALL